MHRMNANRVTEGGTSTLDDASLNRIRDRVGKAANRRAGKHQRVASIKKNANREDSLVTEGQSNTKRIVIASLSELPSDFERIGTGFYRQGHHLWQMMPGEGGFVLVRKRGEDHVLGYSPEPVAKTAAILVTDRNGKELKQGYRVSLPHHGKIAAGTVVVLTPEALGIDLDHGGRVDAPPDMVEWAEEESHEPEHAETGEALEKFVKEEVGEEEHSDKQGGDVFEPDISEKAKSDYVGPQSSQVGGPGGVVNQNQNEGSRNVLAKKKAQTTPTVEPSTPPQAPPSQTPEPEPFEPMDSRLVESANAGPVGIMGKDGLGPYLVTKVGDGQYKIEIIQTNKIQADTVDEAGLAEFDRNLGQWYEMPHLTKLARIAKREVVVGILRDMTRIASTNVVDMKSWKEYWQGVGQRIAESMPPKPPKPKMTDAEKKEKAKQRRELRALERKGLPKGVKLPPKGGAKNTDELARMKEYNKLLEQAIDGIAYALESVADPSDDVLVADAVAQEIERLEEEKARLDEQNQDGMEDMLSLDEPSQAEMDGIDINRTSNNKQANKVVVSMSDL